ncbi:MAG: DUF4421 domain-containing protein [Muribaculaceae bacterium]|nr:DUF4421 domain-containing protein [Muribaculaceae bacterium]
MRNCCLLLILMLCLPMLSWGQLSEQIVAQHQDSLQLQPVDTVQSQGKLQQMKSRVQQRIDEKLNEPYDTTRNKGYWWRALKHGKVDFNDRTMGYPKFVMFCYRTYVWGDRTFNSYDTSYVQATGKNWKLILKSDNWVDSYIGHPVKDVNQIMNSNLVSNIGLSLSFMAVSVGYSVNVSNLLHGSNLSNKFDFSFTCARFAADAYYWENNNEINVTYKVKNSGEGLHKLKQSGVSRKATGLTAYYFFNNRRYAQAAAYCFSKYQKRSAGSWLAGFSLQHFDVSFDVEQFSDEVRAYFPSQDEAPRILYNDYCLLFGYGHNWVLGRKWLLNVTATPYLGYRYNHFHHEDWMPSAVSLNIRVRTAAVYNLKKFFVGFQGFADHHRYKTKNSRLVNSTIDFTALAGIRF